VLWCSSPKKTGDFAPAGLVVHQGWGAACRPPSHSTPRKHTWRQRVRVRISSKNQMLCGAALRKGGGRRQQHHPRTREKGRERAHTHHLSVWAICQPCYLLFWRGSQTHAHRSTLMCGLWPSPALLLSPSSPLVRGCGRSCEIFPIANFERGRTHCPPPAQQSCCGMCSLAALVRRLGLSERYLTDLPIPAPVTTTTCRKMVH
jgi:hypothetical protein